MEIEGWMGISIQCKREVMPWNSKKRPVAGNDIVREGMISRLTPVHPKMLAVVLEVPDVKGIW
jgi:hypothetical protein